MALLPAVGCQGSSSEPAPRPAAPAIEVRDATGSIVARVKPGRPCRASVDGIELLVGGRPLVAQVGTDRWTGEDATNGTTLKKNDAPVARIHAKQLFDQNGIPLIRVLESGDIVDKANAVSRKAVATPAGITIGDLQISGTQDVVLAAMLTAREALPEVR
ncbi:MAG TPA: hypothetical protein VFO79_01235, partial [Xanthomonadales bacterium]|nr:hypothetical protein [Xanthomonadales bacterium]